MELLKAKKPVKGMVVASEKHEDGSPHVHAFILLDKAFNCQNARFWDIHVGDTVYHGDYQKCRNIDDVVKYIKKDGDILEFGDIDWKEKVDARREHRKAVARCLIDGTKTLAQAIDDDPTLLFGARHLKQDLETYHQAKIQPLEASDVRGIWIYGPPGVGKSRLVRQEEKSLYLKSQNKWFDGYIGQKAILIDDFDKKDCLSHYLKIWADRYGCTGEVKGAQVSLCHEGSLSPPITTPRISLEKMRSCLKLSSEGSKLFTWLTRPWDYGATTLWTLCNQSWNADGVPTSTQLKIINVQLNYYGLFDS